MGIPAALASRMVAVVPWTDGPQERNASVSAQCDHLGVSELTSGSTAAAPVRRVGLDAMAGRACGASRGDSVGSPWAGSVH